MSLHSDALSDHQLLTWLHTRLDLSTKTAAEDASTQDLLLSNLLDELIHNIQRTSRTALLQMLLTAHDYQMLQGTLDTVIAPKKALQLLHALKELLLYHNADDNIAALLALLPEELRSEYRALVLNEAADTADYQPSIAAPVIDAPVTESVDNGPQEAFESRTIQPPDAPQIAADDTALTERQVADACDATCATGHEVEASTQTDITHSAISDTDEIEAPIVASMLAREHPLLIVIDMALEYLSSIMSAPESDWQNRATNICEHLDNITFTAESYALDDFALLFSKWAESLQQDITTNPTSLVQKIGEMPALLSAAKQQAISLLESSSISDKAAEKRDCDVSLPLSAPQLTPYNDESYSDERLAVLAEELHDIEPELLTLATALVETEDDGLITPLIRYCDLMSRLSTVCDALGMEGLKKVVIAITDNINVLVTIEKDSRTQALPLLISWPTIVDRYLRNPTDDASVDTLIDFLQSIEWPAPLTGLDSRDLFALLIEGPTSSPQNLDTHARPIEAQPDDISLDYDPDINRELLESFLIEAPELAREFNSIITHLGEGTALLDNLRAAQRLSHTLKGSANLIGIKGIANLAHHTEDILDMLARTRSTPPAPLREALARSGDCLEGMIEAVHGLDAPPQDALEVLQLTLDWANLTDRGELDKLPIASPPDTVTPTHESDVTPPESPDNTNNSSTATPLSSVRVASNTIDDMFRLVEEITISQGQVREQVNRLKKLGDLLASHEQTLQSKRFNLENLVDVRSIANMQRKVHRQRVTDNEFDPLEMDQYDELHAATHSYIEAVADARELNQFVVNNISQLDSLLLRQDRLNKELQQIVGTTRLVPVSVIASRLERAVRQACRMTQKQASLAIIGRQFLIDGEVLDKLVDPLLHILRNAVDHGIEFPDERIEMGKDPLGVITLEFRQEGNHIAVSCCDDGRGLDYERIKEVAVSKGLLTPTQQAGHEQLAQFILSPAFTTRSSATQLSGRGIGMDAVQTVIAGLKGTLAIADQEQGGTEFIIRIPTSLVTNHSLIVRCGDNRFAIPTSYLEQILPPGSGRFSLYGDSETFQLGNTYYPLYSLNALLGFADEIPNESKTVLLSSGTGRATAAIAVDYVIQSAELVVKGLGKYVRHVPSSIGVSVLGDGQVIPVIDLPQLISRGHGVNAGNIIDSHVAQSGIEDGAAQRPSVLIVDDSLSVRNTLSQLLSDFGYRTETARDGVEALEILRKQQPAIVLTDLEMPRMDGMDLVRTLRNNPDTSLLPVIMITSRTQAKHRSSAEQAGINAYVTKPFIEEELLDTISALLQSNAHT